MTGTKKAILGADGRVLGSRAETTRARLLEATSKLLSEQGVLDLKIVDITREVGSSPATFYQYFVDVDAALLALADEATRDELPLAAHFESDWEADDGVQRAREFVDAYTRFWDDHNAVLRVRNLKAEEGHPAFRESRSDANLLMIAAMRQMVERAQADGRLPDSINPFVAAAAVIAIMERLLPYRNEIARRGASVDAQRDTIAELVHRALTGR
ncbi:MAG: transcriptional regulator, TetR family [Ilumatobacteraceae bacterium]|nr:transcriptional regulator, TetR family [Ilumatobacteraceae bacterium]